MTRRKAASRAASAPTGAAGRANPTRASDRNLDAGPVAPSTTGARDLLIVLALAVIVFAIYGQTRHFEFLIWDDPGYVSENAHVRGGLTLEGVLWALRTGQLANWHPLTWISHMLDVEIYGLAPGGHHLTSVLLHALNSGLLYWIFRRMTGDAWRSAFVAALFAVHPLHVESVAWVSERKDVLSTFLAMLTLAAYVLFTERRPLPPRGALLEGRPSPRIEGAHGGRRAGWYAAVVVLFALGLMSKPMLVTLPFVLLLLDHWPLARGAFGRSQLLEKVPLLALAAVSSIVTFRVQRQGGAMLDVEKFPIGDRFGNAMTAYWRYMGKMLWPAGLSVHYPFEHWGAWQVGLSAVALVSISVLVVWTARSLPWLSTGWFWYVGMLVPVIGLVQVGTQSIADRYTYVPLIGLFIVVVWGAAAVGTALRLPPRLLGVAGFVILGFLAFRSYERVTDWRTSDALFTRALVADPENALAHNLLGFDLVKKGREADADRHFREAIRIEPGYIAAHYNLGLLLARRGDFAEASTHLEGVVKSRPDFAEARRNFGGVLDSLGREEDAEREFSEAVRLDPGDPKARRFLAGVLAARHRDQEAVRQYEEALRIEPNDAETLFDLGVALADMGHDSEAIDRYREALRSRPDYPDARYNMGLLLARQGRHAEAIQEFQEILTKHPDHQGARAALRFALQQQGQLPDSRLHSPPPR